MNSWFRGYSLVAILLVGLLGVGLSLASVSSAQDAAEVNYALVNTILLISAVLVIFMQAGFALVEVGLNSSKNAVNILAKNLLDFGISVILFFGIGYGLMYPGADYAGKYFGFDSSRRHWAGVDRLPTAASPSATQVSDGEAPG